MAKNRPDTLLTPLHFDTNCDRSVQGAMRITRFDIDGFLMTMADLSDIRDVPMYALSAKLNHEPVRTKDVKASQCLWPKGEMQNYLKEL